MRHLAAVESSDEEGSRKTSCDKVDKSARTFLIGENETGVLGIFELKTDIMWHKILHSHIELSSNRYPILLN